MANKFYVGDRVKVNMDAGFHRGAIGTVKYVEPSGKCWVERDKSGSDVWYDPGELTLIPCVKKRNTKDVMDILQEECAEVIQAVSKIRRFGLEESWDGHTNKQALITELGDVIAIIDILMDETDINITMDDITKAVEAKKKKLEIFLPYE